MTYTDINESSQLNSIKVGDICVQEQTTCTVSIVHPLKHLMSSILATSTMNYSLILTMSDLRKPHGTAYSHSYDNGL
jgi:hypothetical protein